MTKVVKSVVVLLLLVATTVSYMEISYNNTQNSVENRQDKPGGT
ncbi:hypothetical protein SAMN05444487_11858 [Marininema mesophilum]|uniref:Uncharacterized protein n=1 Tax=Marininema mesophilum TaxID=1048340 RepID=A0A1H3BYA5_9BACL|nr:hypothetical protein [Marininema mesophilum]SDX46179.1 hypothetical protein SAMN05444487_11858 [Marininema mesophilum]